MEHSVNQALRKAQSYARNGHIADARRAYSDILHSYPKNKRARVALSSLDRSESGAAAPLDDPMKHLLAVFEAKQFKKAAKRAIDLLAQQPKSRILWTILGSSLAQMKDAPGAVRAFEQACAVDPNHPDGFRNLGHALRTAGRLADAISAYDRALAHASEDATLWCALGETHNAVGAYDEAIKALAHALRLMPDMARAHFATGIARDGLGDATGAIAAYQSARDLRPDDIAIHTKIGNALQEIGQPAHAISAFQEALKIDAANPVVHYNMGLSWFALGQLDAAIAAYRAALALQPDTALFHNNLGNVYHRIGRLDDALACYLRALHHDPGFALAHSNSAVILQEQGKREEAIASFGQALALDPDLPDAEAQMLHQRQHLCDWSDMDRLREACTRLGVTTKAVATLPLLASEDHPARQLARSQTWVAEKFTHPPKAILPPPKIRPQRLRVGYFSADFRDHPVLHLISGLLRTQDRAQFEVMAFSYGKPSSGDLFEQLKRDVDRFFDVSTLSDAALADLAREQGLDIAIDLTGYTQNTRSSAFQHRLAGVQVNYLGYPASMGADFIDYMIADETVIPPLQRAHYSEKIIYLPHSFQPNDNTRRISDTPTTRADFDLPDGAVVLCCFNNLYKISPAEFDIWMRVLAAVPNSVLWLAQPAPSARTNLRQAARARGVDPDRLVFANRLAEYEAHLARLRHADLFLDTFAYNAHTTASDALWAGLPVVTKCGAQYAARVAASLLYAVGLPELVTHSAPDYEALIVQLARDPDRLRALRSRLGTDLPATPLFDTQRYVRNFEAGLNRAYDLYHSGADGQDIWIREPCCDSDTQNRQDPAQ